MSAGSSFWKVILGPCKGVGRETWKATSKGCVIKQVNATGR